MSGTPLKQGDWHLMNKTLAKNSTKTVLGYVVIEGDFRSQSIYREVYGYTYYNYCHNTFYISVELL